MRITKTGRIRMIKLFSLFIFGGIPSLLLQMLASASPLEFDITSEIPPASYDDLVQSFVNSTRFSFIHPAATTGPTGFDFGIAVSGAEIPKETIAAAESYLSTSSDFPEMIALPRMTAMKGLPYSFDLAVNISMIPSTDILIAGGAIQWSFLDLSFPVPVVSLRVGHTQVIGIEKLTAQSTNAELVASLGIPPGVNLISPFAGAGISVNASESLYEFQNALTGLSQSERASSSWQEVYALVGLRVAIMPFMGITAEMQTSETQDIYSAKLSFSL